VTKPDAPSYWRNRDPILEVLRTHFADRRDVLEIGSGTGQHAVYFGSQLPHLRWQPSDLPDQHDGIRAWVADAQLDNVLSPIELTAHGPWPSESTYDAVFTANTLHIMSWEAVQALFSALPGIMAPDVKLVVYGPFNYGGRYTSDSNRDFDAWLKARDAASGIRDFEAVNMLAHEAELELVDDQAMPANNRCLIWRRNV
jgi:cyclopropane fatty-acyl-phospholipid synthase-like methyltransferase